MENNSNLVDKYIKEINKKSWYRQGGAISVFYTMAAYWSALWHYEGASYYKGSNNYGYFNREKEKKIAQKILNNQLKDKYYINSLVNCWRKIKKKQDIFSEKIEKIDLGRLPDKKFITLLGKFWQYRKKIWLIGIFIESFDAWGDYLLSLELKKFPTIRFSARELTILTQPEVKSYLAQARQELLALALAIHKDRVAIKKIQQNLHWWRKILNYQKKWHYIHNTWWHVGKLPISIILAEIKSTWRNIVSSRREYQELCHPHLISLKKKIPRELANVFYFFRVLSAWRNERKAQMQIVNSYAQKFLKELSRRTGLKINTLKYLNPFERITLPFSPRFTRELKKRGKTSGIYVRYRQKYLWFLGLEAEKIKAAFDARLLASGLKGRSANYGLVRGLARIIITKEDFRKMKKGDILVTQMTRPEFTPILSRAAAIVTDEGGLTCHAAIVSREMNIPCVIGTQVATSVLKNGDKIEVDAYKGIIKKLK